MAKVAKDCQIAIQIPKPQRLGRLFAFNAGKVRLVGSARSSKDALVAPPIREEYPCLAALFRGPARRV